MTTDPIVNALYEKLSELQRRKEKIEWHIRQELEEVKSKISAVQISIGELSDPNGTEASTPAKRAAVEILGPLSHLEALKKIARLSKGIVNADEAASLLIQAGIGKGKRRDVVSHVWTLLTKSEEFEKAGTGEMRLTKDPYYTFCLDGAKHRWMHSSDGHRYACRRCGMTNDKAESVANAR